MPASLWDGLAFYKQDHAWPEHYPPNLATFWAGRDDVHGALKAVITSAQHSLVISMFGYDDDDLDQIIRTKTLDPHIYVQMSLDRSQAAGKHEREILAHWNHDAIGTSIAIGSSAAHAISHLKMVIVDGLYVVGGSTNWSTSGESKQDNELRIYRDAVVAAEARSVLDVIHDTMLTQMHATRLKDGAAQ